MPEATTTTPSEPVSAPASAPAALAAAAETKPVPAEAISDGIGDAGKAAIQKEREARKDLERQLAEAQQLREALAAKVQQYEDAKKTETEKLNDQLTRLQKQIADKDAEIANAKRASLRAEVAAAKGVPASTLSGTTREEFEASADELIAWRDAHSKPPRPPKPPVSALKSGASGSDSGPADPRERAAAALRAFRAGGA